MSLCLFHLKKIYFVFCDPNMFRSRELSSRTFCNLRFIWLLRSLWWEPGWPFSVYVASLEGVDCFLLVVRLLDHLQILFLTALYTVDPMSIWSLCEWNCYVAVWYKYSDATLLIKPYPLFQKTLDPKVWALGGIWYAVCSVRVGWQGKFDKGQGRGGVTAFCILEDFFF